MQVGMRDREEGAARRAQADLALTRRVQQQQPLWQQQQQQPQRRSRAVVRTSTPLQGRQSPPPPSPRPPWQRQRQQPPAPPPRLQQGFPASAHRKLPPNPLAAVSDLRQLSNTLVNEALLISVLALTAYAVFTVDSDAWRGWYPNEILYRIPLDNWRSYEDAVVADPVPIKAAITGGSYLIGDWLAQANTLQQSGKSWLDADRPRLFRATAVGLVLLGPLAHFYYDFVGTLESWPILSKILLDQTAYLAFYNTVYYVALTVLAGKSFGEAVEEYKGSFWLLLTSGWKLWPLVGIVTYTLIPQQNRVLWIDGIEIIYSALLSTLANKEEEEEV